MKFPASHRDAASAGGTNGSSTPDALRAYDVDPVLGAISATLSSETTPLFKSPAPTASISANGNSNGIVWVLRESNYQLNPDKFTSAPRIS